jgi:hypothetical protein
MRGSAINPFIKRAKKRYCLRPESARAILHAERFATALRRPLNAFLTITFNAQPRHPTSTHYDIFRKRIWAPMYDRYKAMELAKGSSKRFAAMAVFENPPNRVYGKRHHGPLHVHMLFEWPESKLKKLEFHVSRALFKYYRGFKPTQIHLRQATYSPGLAKYLVKGIDPPFAEHFYVKTSNQGPIFHRRIIISRSLGHTARKAFKASGRNPLPDRRIYRAWRTSEMK